LIVEKLKKKNILSNASFLEICKLKYIARDLLNKYLTNNNLRSYFTSFLKIRKLDKEEIKKLSQLKRIIIRKDLRIFFKNTLRIIDLGIIDYRSNIGIIISCLFSDLNRFYNTVDYKEKEYIYNINNNNEFDIGNLYSNIRNRNRFLRHLIKIFKQNQEYFYLVIINGSIGTNDYKPGWSDVDLFVMVSKEAVLFPEKLKKLRKLIISIEKQIYKYSILQLHNLFISTEIDRKFHFNSFFPSECIKYGKVIVSKYAKVEFHIPLYAQPLDNYKYFLKDIYLSSFNLLIKRDLSYYDKVLLLHRIFSFPFSFLQCMNIYTYKKHSYKHICKGYNTLFPGISDFYEEVNKFYYSWEIKNLRTLKIRSILLDIIYTPNRVNRIFFRFEKEILDNLTKGFDKYVYPNLQIYANFLCSARVNLNKKLPQEIIMLVENNI